MKITEALATIKTNLQEMEDLKNKVQRHAARHSTEGYEYKTTGPDGVDIDNTRAKVAEWIQAYNQLSLNNINLLIRIQKTNLAHSVSIKFGDVVVTKSVAEWVWRRREYAALDLDIWQRLTDGGKKDEARRDKDGSVEVIKVIRNYDPELRDKKVAMYKLEAAKGGLIDVHLAIFNATTDLMD